MTREQYFSGLVLVSGQVEIVRQKAALISEKKTKFSSDYSLKCSTQLFLYIALPVTIIVPKPSLQP